MFLFIKRLAHKARALEVIKLPETASANDIYNSFSPSVIKGGLDDENLSSDDAEVPVLGKIAAGTPGFKNTFTKQFREKWRLFWFESSRGLND